MDNKKTYWTVVEQLDIGFAGSLPLPQLAKAKLISEAKLHKRKISEFFKFGNYVLSCTFTN